jgi:cell division protein FtsZ
MKPAMAPAPAPSAPAPAPKESRLSLFSRYRSLTAKKAEPAKTPEPAPARNDRPSFTVAVNPVERPSITSHDDDELEIPAFLRRQAN